MSENFNNNEEVFSSALLQYIHKNTPQLMRFVLSVVQDIIEREQNYDPNNTSMILCNQDLEKALNVKSCHIGQLNEILHKRLALPMFVYHPFIPSTVRANHRRYSVRGSPYRALVRCHNIHLDSKVLLRPKFAELLSTIDGPHKNQSIFRWEEVCNLVSKYIQANRVRIIDARNESVLNLRDDKMGQLFGVISLHRNQINGFIREQIIPYDLENE